MTLGINFSVSPGNKIINGLFPHALWGCYIQAVVSGLSIPQLLSDLQLSWDVTCLKIWISSCFSFTDPEMIQRLWNNKSFKCHCIRRWGCGEKKFENEQGWKLKGLEDVLGDCNARHRFPWHGLILAALGPVGVQPTVEVASEPSSSSQVKPCIWACAASPQQQEAPGSLEIISPGLCVQGWVKGLETGLSSTWRWDKDPPVHTHALRIPPVSGLRQLVYPSHSPFPYWALPCWLSTWICWPKFTTHTSKPALPLSCHRLSFVNLRLPSALW